MMPLGFEGTAVCGAFAFLLGVAMTIIALTGAASLPAQVLGRIPLIACSVWVLVCFAALVIIDLMRGALGHGT